VVDAVSCRELADEGDYHKLSFQVWGVHLNAFPDGRYRITPTLKGTWSRPANPVLFFGSRTIEPQSFSVVLKKDDHIQSVAFELVQRPRRSGDNIGRGDSRRGSGLWAAKRKQYVLPTQIAIK
jgi:hypothetical protein